MSRAEKKCFTNQIRVVKDFLQKTESELLKCNRIYRKGKGCMENHDYCKG
eukprot:UN21042